MNIIETKNIVKELLELRKEVARLKGVESNYKGLLAELRVQNLIPGSNITSLTCQNGDIIDMKNESIEVKFSSDNGSVVSPKWDWNHIFGAHNKKQFDKLVLIGIFGHSYKFFCIRKDNISQELLGRFKNGYRISIRYSERASSKYQRCLKQYECHSTEIVNK